MKTKPEKDVELYAKINQETARLPWSELERHFALGNVVYVSPELDLIDVAARISHDDKETVMRWMSEGKVSKVTDAQAELWAKSGESLWTSIVSPFILVQPEKRTLQ